MMSSYRSIRLALSACALLLSATAAAAAPGPVAWTAVTKSTVSGGSIQKTSGCSGCPDAGAVSQQQFTSGSVSFTVAPGAFVLAGLGQSATGSLGYAVNYAFKFAGGSSWEIRESNTYRTEGAFAASDVFTVATDGATVRYYRNGSVVYTSKVPPPGLLVVDTTLVTIGAAISASTDAAATTTTTTTTGTNAVVWTAVVKASASGGNLQKTSGCGDCADAGAISQQEFTAGSVTFTVAAGQRTLAGLGRDAQPGYAIDYSFGFSGSTSWDIREAGVYRTEGTYASGDVFKVASDGATVRYYRNGSLVYTSKTPVPGALRVDVTLVSIGARVDATTDVAASTATAAPAPAPTGSTLRVLQWNVHHGGYGTDNIYSPDRVATWIAKMNPDVVTLNEIEKYTYWGNQDQPEVYKNLLQQKTGKTWYIHFAQEYGDWNSNGKGNLILSTYPVNFSDRYELLRNYDRSIGEVEITVNGRNISLILTHLDPYDATLRLAQASEVTTWSAVQPENRILTGDMNAWPDQASIAKFNQYYYDSWTVAAAQGTATAFSGNNGETKNGRIDYIFYSKGSSNLTVKSSQVYDTRDANGVMPSDHRPVLTTFIVQ